MVSSFKKVLGDATLKILAFAFPNAAVTTVFSAAIDLGLFGNVRPIGLTVVIAYGALTVTQLPDTTTTTITLEGAADAAFTTTITPLGVWVLTGAGGVGAAAGQLHFTILSGTPEFIRMKVVTGTGTGSQVATTASLTLEV